MPFDAICDVIKVQIQISPIKFRMDLVRLCKSLAIRKGIKLCFEFVKVAFLESTKIPNPDNTGL